MRYNQCLKRSDRFRFDIDDGISQVSAETQQPIQGVPLPLCAVNSRQSITQAASKKKMKQMYHKLIPAVLALAAGTSMAFADDDATATKGLVMNYEVFENTVHHADLETCPEEFADQAVFCRLTMAHDQLNVIVFSEDADQPMIAVQQVDLGKTELAF